MGIKTIKRLASDILNAGESRVKVKDIKKTETALTRDDVRSLIKKGVIYVIQKKGVSRARGKLKEKKKGERRRRGIGSRKGKKYSKIPRKEIWMSKVRAQRALLRELAETGKLLESRRIYKMIKGGNFKSKEALLTYLKKNELLRG